jgi:hypothetical protein
MMEAVTIPAVAPLERPGFLWESLEGLEEVVGEAMAKVDVEEGLKVRMLLEVRVDGGGVTMAVEVVGGVVWNRQLSNSAGTPVTGSGRLTTAVSGPNMVVLPIVLVTTASVLIVTVSTAVSVTSALDPVIVVEEMVRVPSVPVSVTVTTVSGPAEPVETDNEVRRDSTTVGTVVVTTIGFVAMGMEF